MEQTKKVYLELMLAMLRTGILGFGGGPSVMPLFQHEAVKKYHWMNEADFDNTLAIANVLPGPIATKMAAHLGYERKGWLGAIWSIFWHILPSTIAMAAFISMANVLSHSTIVQGIIAAVTPVVFMMLLLMGYRFAKKAYEGLGFILTLIACVLAAVLLYYIHPALVIFIFIIYGTQHYRVAKGGAK